MFSQKIKEASQTINREQQVTTSIARVLKADELNNCCDIELENNYGHTIKLYSVRYQINDPKLSSYFPVQNDWVCVQCASNKSYLITGPYYRKDQLSRSGLYKSHQNKMYFNDYCIFEGNIL